MTIPLCPGRMQEELLAWLLDGSYLLLFYIDAERTRGLNIFLRRRLRHESTVLLRSVYKLR